jgi:uncharacterized protein
MNRLLQESSPYLRQHMNDPVDWRVWGAVTLAEAATVDKPILLSIGYAACHWCHVMAQESFQDKETAALINALFVPVKVDREERPDLDLIYQNALSRLGQSGGWPLTMFLTPAGEPFWGGTYYPPEPKYGRPGFRDILQRISEVYRNQAATVATNIAALRPDAGQRPGAAKDRGFGPSTLNQAALKIGAFFDPVDGGLGRAPKFPQSPVLAMMWRNFAATGAAADRDAVLLTLERMVQGGIYDHLGGGFARYSTDNEWLVPHFEKMLYDNAQLIELLTWAWQETGNPLVAARVDETISWLLREMRVEGGGFAAALDADSEHEEGKFYVWRAAEVDAVLGVKAAFFKRHYDVHRIGNWEGKSILRRSERPELLDAEGEAELAALRHKLLAVRDRRIRPLRDHKVLADINGLTISALVLAAGVFGRPDWLAAAEQAFDFVTTRMTTPERRLQHSWCDGRVHPGILDDHASMARAALALHQIQGKAEYLGWAESWVAVLGRHFRAPDDGGFFFTPDDAPDLIARLRTAHDNATPSGNGMMIEVLAALFYATGNVAYRDAAEHQIGAFAGEISDNFIPYAAFLSGADFFFNAVLIVLIDGAGSEALMRAVDDVSLPNRLIARMAPGAIVPPGHPAAGKTRIGDRATAYVCVRQTCSAPVTEPEILRALLLQRRGATAMNSPEIEIGAA